MQYTQAGLPRWRGFNLLGMYTTGHEGYFLEEDFQLIAELGFDFVRLPLSYRTWTVDGGLGSHRVSLPGQRKGVGVHRRLCARGRKIRPAYQSEFAPRAGLLHQSRRKGALQSLEGWRSGQGLCLALGALCQALSGHSLQSAVV